jgi:hypothetical protein
MWWTVALFAAGYWLLFALPLWWFFVAFGAPLPPQPTNDVDALQVFFLASFYVPLVVLVVSIFGALRGRKREQD